jgi:hypothetical protein
MNRVVGIAVVACALAGVAAPVCAQTIGLKLGLTSSRLEFDPDEGDQDRMTEFGGGAFARFDLGAVTLQTEVLGVIKGSDANFDNVDDDIDGTLKLEYIEVPITALIEIGRGPYIFAGPAIAFEVGCSVEQLDCDDDNAETTILPRHTADIGLTAGVGFQISAGPGAFLIEGRHTWGLSNIIDTSADRSAHNSAYALLVGYAISTGSR